MCIHVRFEREVVPNMTMLITGADRNSCASNFRCLRFDEIPYGTITLHDLILGQSTGMFGTLHGIAIAHVGVLDVGQAKGPATVLITSELGCVYISK
jgi:hypothetical protein